MRSARAVTAALALATAAWAALPPGWDDVDEAEDDVDEPWMTRLNQCSTVDWEPW